MFKFILLTVLAYIIFRWLDRMFRVGSKPTQNRSTRNSSAKKEGFNSSKKTKSVIKDDVGEYVDYEDLDEDKN